MSTVERPLRQYGTRVSSHPPRDTVVVRIPAYQIDAACRSSDPIEQERIRLLFFPDDTSRKLRHTARERDDAARAICYGCPVFQECADWIAEADVRSTAANDGMWAGTTAAQRAPLRAAERQRRGLVRKWTAGTAAKQP